MASPTCYNNYVIRAERRDDLKQFLAESGIQSEIYYPLPLHLQKCFADLGYKQGDFPKAEAAAQQVLALPLYPEFTLAQQEAVVERSAPFIGAKESAFFSAGPMVKIFTL